MAVMAFHSVIMVCWNKIIFSPLESHDEKFYEERCLSRVFSDNADVCADLLSQVDSQTVSCAQSLHSKWVEDMCEAQCFILALC